MRFVLLGHPIRQSLSPAMHRAAYASLGLPHEYDAVDVPDPQTLAQYVDGVRAGTIGGANVTVPHKREALRLADEVAESAKAVGAANVLGRRGNVVVAHNTDVPALADVLGAAHPGARTAGVIGSGGAALAAVVACLSIGVERVVVVARSFPERAAEFTRLGADTVAWPPQSGFASSLPVMDIVVQATTAGMLGADSGEELAATFPFRALPAGAFVYDLVYNPAVTPFVRHARAAGVRAETGLGMLVGQACRAIELWTGRCPAFSVLERAATRALGQKS